MKKKLIALFLFGSLMLTGCSKLERIIDILFEEETEAAETTPADTDQSETTGKPEAPETQTPAAPETETPAKPEETQTAEKPETKEPESAFPAEALGDIIDLKILISEKYSKNLGVMFLGTCEGKYSDVTSYLRNLGGGLDASYPWLMDVPQENFISRAGEELYAVIPGEDWKMTVYEYGFDSSKDSMPARGKKLYEGSDPVLLQGNISDIVPEFQVVLEKDGDTVEYCPCLSLEDGKLQQSSDVQDFTPYDLLMKDAAEEIPNEGAAFAGFWECETEDVHGKEVMLYLTMAEDGGLAYSYGYGNSEMAEIFGGSWGTADGNMYLNLTGGVFDLELGYVADPYDFHSLYSYEWVEYGSVFTLKLKESTALFYGSEDKELTFRCAGPVDIYFDPLHGVKPPEMDTDLCMGEWYSTYAHPDGYDLAMYLTINEDGTASYRYGFGGGAGELYESFDGTWIADAAGNFYLDLHGGSVKADDESEYYDFDGKFKWDLYGNHLALTHEEGSPLIAGCENWCFEFLDFNYIFYDGEWIVYDGARHYSLNLLSNGEAMYTITEGTSRECHYSGWWILTDDEKLELSMMLTEGEGSKQVASLYELEWVEYPGELRIKLLDGDFALTGIMASSGDDVFSWIDPNAVG